MENRTKHRIPNNKLQKGKFKIPSREELYSRLLKQMKEPRETVELTADDEAALAKSWQNANESRGWR